MEDIKYLFDPEPEEITETGFYYVDSEDKTKYQANVKDLSELNIVGKIKCLYYTINRIYYSENISEIFQIKHIPLFKINLDHTYFNAYETLIYNCDIENIENNYFGVLMLYFCIMKIDKSIIISRIFKLCECNIRMSRENFHDGIADIPYLIKANHVLFSAPIIYPENENYNIEWRDVRQIGMINEYKNKLYMDLDFTKNIKLLSCTINTCYTPNNNINFRNIECITFYLRYCKGKFTIPNNINKIDIKFCGFTYEANNLQINTENIQELCIGMSKGDIDIFDVNFILNYPKLEILEIEKELKIKYLPDLSSLTKLKKLIIKDNLLEELPILPNSLEILDARNNKIKSFYNIPKSLKHITFDGNPENIAYQIRDIIKINKDSEISLVSNKLLSLKEYAIQYYIKNIDKYNNTYEVSQYFDYNKLKNITESVTCEGANTKGASILRFLENHSLIEDIRNGCSYCERCKKYSFKYRHINFVNNQFCCCSQ